MKTLHYAIVYVSDMKRSVAFYRDALGIPVKFESPDWTELANDGSTIALHQASLDAADDTAENRAGSCQLGFQVEDLDATHRTLQERHVPCTTPPRTQPYGVRLASYRDPDGLSISISQRLAEG